MHRENSKLKISPVISLRCGIIYVFLKYIILEYNPSVQRFNVAMVDSNYLLTYLLHGAESFLRS